MTVIIGNYDKLSGSYDPGHSTNQWGQGFTVPSAGHITRLGGWLGDPYEAAYDNWTFAVWDHVAGAVLAQSALQIYAFQDSYLHRFEANLLTPLAVTAGQQVRLGWEWVIDGSAALIFGYQAGSGPMYKKYTSSSVPVSFAGGTSVSGILNAYGYLVPSGGQAKVRRGGVWVDAEINVRRSGIWVPPTSIKVRRGGGWTDL